jgi:hypothetical protein
VTTSEPKDGNSSAAGPDDISDRKSSAQHVQAWLKNHGAALEMEVASKMLVGPSTVEHSGYFRDAKTGALREFDVHATFRKHTYVPPISFEIHVIAECKASAPPWVLYMASDTFGARDWDFETFFETSSHAAKTVRNLSSFSFAPLFRTARPHAYQVAEAATKNSTPYAAVQQVLDAVEGIRASHVASDESAAQASDSRDTRPALRIYVPILITTSPLFEVRLSATGETEVTETHVAPLFTKRDRDGAVIDRLVWVAHQSAIDEVVRMTMSSLDTMNLGSESAAD